MAGHRKGLGATESAVSPFTSWKDRSRPSIFADDPAFTPKNAAGQTMSQIGSDTVARRTRETGRNPGTITGISRESKKTELARKPKAWALKSGVG